MTASSDWHALVMLVMLGAQNATSVICRRVPDFSKSYGKCKTVYHNYSSYCRAFHRFGGMPMYVHIAGSSTL